MVTPPGITIYHTKGKGKYKKDKSRRSKVRSWEIGVRRKKRSSYEGFKKKALVFSVRRSEKT
jgi:hypothetical protein